ncbi:MAG: helix-turn-helix transcriptional regulator [Kineosporiaceae bacterium]
MAEVPTGFWQDLDNDLQDPEFRSQFLLESERIATVDRIVNQLDDIRQDLGMTKSELARAIGHTPESIRRLLTAKSVNPQLSLVAELASVLGYRVTLQPITAAGASRSPNRFDGARRQAEPSPKRPTAQASERGLRARYSSPRARTSLYAAPGRVVGPLHCHDRAQFI